MVRGHVFLSIILLCPLVTFAQTTDLRFHDKDISNFWEMYDLLSMTDDSVAQKQIIHELYIDSASLGLRDLMEVRNYSIDEYYMVLTSYPLFWESIRENTLYIEDQYAPIRRNISQLKTLYPSLSNVPIYFALGAFRTNGTINREKTRILIGAEMATVDSGNVKKTELPSHLKEYYSTYNPVENLPFLVAHEYVHTQQNDLVHNLLSYCIYEGIAEFVATLSSENGSYISSIQYHQTNFEQVRNRFEAEMYIPYKVYDWLWSSNEILGHRDMGYAVGFEIARKYYESASDKEIAIQKMIELDLSNENEVEAYLDASGYFTQPLELLYQHFQESRPFVTHISGVENGSDQVKPGKTTITIHFSEVLNGYNTGVDYGELGEAAFPKVTDRSWNNDATSWNISVELEPETRYQILISNNFRTENDIPLKPYLIDFTTSK